MLKSFIFLSVFVLSFILCFGGVVQASVQQAESKFREGVEAFQKKDLPTARVAFVESLKENQQSAVALYNLGLVEAELGKNGQAIALWRKALALKPGYSAAENSIDWASRKLERQEIAHEVETWERLRPIFFQQVSFLSYFLASIFFLAASGALLLHYFGARRRALIDERPLPKTPLAPALCVLFFICFATLTVLKVVDEQDLRATIVAKKVEARSTPDAEATSLFDLYEGLEVIVQSQKGDWIQVTYPGGATGWVPKSAVMSLKDRVET
jgi:tetratricopeptide (TPR) repeat protein